MLDRLRLTCSSRKRRDQIVDGRGSTLGLQLSQRIAALIDLPLELPGLLARAGDGPIGKCADGVAPLAPRPVVVGQHEGAMPGGGDADTEAGQGRVVGNAIALRGRRQSLDRGLRQSVRVHTMSIQMTTNRFRQMSCGFLRTSRGWQVVSMA